MGIRDNNTHHGTFLLLFAINVE